MMLSRADGDISSAAAEAEPLHCEIRITIATCRRDHVNHGQQNWAWLTLLYTSCNSEEAEGIRRLCANNKQLESAGFLYLSHHTLQKSLHEFHDTLKKKGQNQTVSVIKLTQRLISLDYEMLVLLL